MWALKKVDRRFIRNVYAGGILEVFIVTAVASILLIRAFLSLTGYPQVSGGGLHIAHVLVGGIFMLASMILLMAFLDRSSRNFAAVIGGFGFGAFIDELGKFITSDNNYFFQPTVGLIYVVFILIYLAIRQIGSISMLSEQERLINVLEISKEAVLKDLDDGEKKMAMTLLEESDSSDEVVESLKETLRKIQSVPDTRPGLYVRIRARAHGLYQRLVRKRWFTNAMVSFFLLQSVIYLFDSLYHSLGILNALLLAMAAFLIFGTLNAISSKRSWMRRLFYALAFLILVCMVVVSVLDLKMPSLSFSEWGQIAFTFLASLLAVAGIFYMHKSRLRAYGLFRNSVLVQIFFVQVFVFFNAEFYGLIGLSWNITIYLVLRYMMNEEAGGQGISPISTRTLVQ